MTKPMSVGWFYVTNEAAAPILAKIFQQGVARAGSAITLSQNDFETLRDGMICYPVHHKEEEGQLVLVGGIPEAS